MTELELRESDFLREAIEHLDDKAKADLKVALYGSGFFLALSLIPYGELKYASLLVAAIDLWYFMSWGNDQLRLVQHRDALKRLEGPGGVEDRQERHGTYVIERGLYYCTSTVIVALFFAGLAMDWQAILDPVWRVAFVGAALVAFVAIAAAFFVGLSRGRRRRPD